MLQHNRVQFSFHVGFSSAIQCRMNNSSKCNNFYRPRAFGGPAVFCNKSYLLHSM